MKESYGEDLANRRVPLLYQRCLSQYEPCCITRDNACHERTGRWPAGMAVSAILRKCQSVVPSRDDFGCRECPEVDPKNWTT